ncbi:MAG TPA: PASTA domain-containing protein [Flavobacteriales bacterium]
MSFISYIKSAAFGKTLLKIVLLYGILIAVSWFWLKWYTDHGEYVTVPELRGMSLEEAISALEDRNLQYLVVDSVYDRKATPGAILDQNPSPESQVKEGRQVFLTIYRINPPMEKIGIKEGDFATVALIKLANKGIDFDTLYEDNNTLAGSIIRVLYNNKKVTSPDFEVPRGSKVKLVIGRAASSKVTVPDLYGKTCAEAEQILESMNLICNCRFEPGINFPTPQDSAVFRVCRQSPEADPIIGVSPGRIVDLFLYGTPCPRDTTDAH